MIRTLTRNVMSAGVRLIHALHLHWVLSLSLRHMPRGLRLWLSRLQLRVGYLQGMVLVPESELERSYEEALRMLGSDARSTYLEFGVYIGTSIACMFRAGQRTGTEVRLVGFDSFEGLPASAPDEDLGRWRAGQFHSDLELTKLNLERIGVPVSRVELVPGWFEDSLTDATRTRLGLSRADVVMIDCDVGSSARIALDFCVPLLERAIVFFDDWDSFELAHRGLGERGAFDSWREAHPEFVVQELPDLRYAPLARAFLVMRDDR